VNYTSDDIRRYTERNLSPAEMHAMEEAAHHDPFLSDAIEGMMIYPGSVKNFTSHTLGLKQRLRLRISASGHRTIQTRGILWKAAAILIVITSGATMIYYTGQKSKIMPTSVAEKERRAYDSQDAQQSSLAKQRDTVAMSAERGTAMKRKTASQKTTPKALVSPDSIKKREVEETNSPAIVDETSKFDRAASVASVPAEQQFDSVEGRSSEIPAAPQFRSKSAGNTDLKKSEDNLKPVAEPESGWDNFYRFIRDNKKITDTTRTRISVSFKVNRHGKVTSPKVLSTVSKDIETEVIRLIRVGPRWIVHEGHAREINISVQLW